MGTWQASWPQHKWEGGFKTQEVGPLVELTSWGWRSSRCMLTAAQHKGQNRGWQGLHFICTSPSLTLPPWEPPPHKHARQRVGNVAEYFFTLGSKSRCVLSGSALPRIKSRMGTGPSAQGRRLSPSETSPSILGGCDHAEPLSHKGETLSL